MGQSISVVRPRAYFKIKSCTKHMFQSHFHDKIEEKGVFAMLKRYELTDQEWKQIAPLLSLEKSARPGRPSKDNRTMLNAMVWIACSGAPWRELPERYGPWETVYSRFRKWIEDGIWTISSVYSVSKPNYKSLVWMPRL